MTANHHRFIVFSTIHGNPIAHASTAEAALMHADCSGWPDQHYFEIIDCGLDGLGLWYNRHHPTSQPALSFARQHHRTVFRNECAVRFEPQPAGIAA